MSRWKRPQQGTSVVSAEVASRVGESTQGGWTLVIAQNLPRAQTQIESPRQSLKWHRAMRTILTSSSYISQGPWILAPVLPLTAMDPWRAHLPSLGLSSLPCKADGTGLMRHSRLWGSELCSQGWAGVGPEPGFFLPGEATEKGRDIIPAQEKVHLEAMEERHGETEPGNVPSHAVGCTVGSLIWIFSWG